MKNFAKAFASEFRIAVHDQGILVFLILLPLAYPVLYSLIYNPEFARDVAVVVVDNDRTSLSRELARNLDACQEVKVIGYAADLSEAKRAMDSRDCFAIIEIPKGFQRKVGRGETANAVFYSDMSLLIRYKGVLTAATNVALAMGSELQAKKIDEVVPLAATLSSGDR
ncbi:MAG: ABC transporter permease [Muribaculaceae bacterium]|nr:ABC transporter permease [Muribaculaceae bacterium]